VRFTRLANRFLSSSRIKTSSFSRHRFLHFWGSM
jgi:hypothetical protein